MLEVLGVVALLLLCGLLVLDGACALAWALSERSRLPALPPPPVRALRAGPYRGVASVASDCETDERCPECGRSVDPRTPLAFRCSAAKEIRRRNALRDRLRYMAPECWPDWFVREMEHRE